jgi:hypothetical protein
VETVAWRISAGVPAVDASEETDYGGVDSYRFDGRVHGIAGEIGELIITCDPPHLVLETDTGSNLPIR